MLQHRGADANSVDVDVSLSADVFPGVSLPGPRVLGGQLCSSRSLLSLLPSQSVLLDAHPGKNVHHKHL